MGVLTNVTPEDHEKFHALIEGVNEVIERVFDLEADQPKMVLGVQFGQMGKEDHPELPACLVTSNLDPHTTPDAIGDMLEVADALHREEHGEPETDEEVEARFREQLGLLDGDPADLDSIPATDPSVPEAVRQAAADFAESMGMSVDDVSVVNLGSLDPMLDFDIDAEQESKES